MRIGGGSWGVDPLGFGFVVGWVSAGLEAFNDDHPSAASGAWEAEDPRVVLIFFRMIKLDWRRGVEQGSQTVEIGGALAVGEQTVMPDPVEPVRKDVDQKASDELERLEAHGSLPKATVASVVLVSEDDTVFVGLD